MAHPSPDTRSTELTRDPFVQLLLRKRLLTPQACLEVQELREISRRPLLELLTESSLVMETDLARTLAELLRVPFVELGDRPFTAEQLNLLPESYARKHTALPLGREGKRLDVVMADPRDLDAIQEMSFATGYSINPSVGVPSELRDAIERFYSRHLEGADVLMAAGTPAATDLFLIRWGGQASDLDARPNDAPVIQLLNLIMRKAIQMGASDIHIEPGKEEGTVRFRLDGLLVDQLQVPSGIHPSLISRLKILGCMDIAERRLPQDGSVRVKVEEREVDLRLSILPLRFGEKAVIRILDASTGAFELDSIGFLSEDLDQVEQLIHRHMGMVIMTGPTGSGKTTTLYSMLNRIKNRTINIVTVEDPIEYNYDGLNQMQVNADIGLTFAGGLRSILRQDPDVILVGEIRDAETAEIACRAALTGHLVFTTLHTNDAPSSITRLLDIGVPRYLAASVLSGIIAQRLVRRICPDCAEDTTPDPETVHSLGLNEAALRGGHFRIGKGCPRCHKTGYRGRMGVFEILVLNARMRELILRGAGEEDLRLAAQESATRTLVEDGLIKAKQGRTTLPELGRVLEVPEYAASGCQNCGRLLNTEYRFCPFCRTPQLRSCSACGRPLQAEWNYCAACGNG